MTDIEPIETVRMVEEYIEAELTQEEKYENRSLFDESGIWSLHQLAARIYAAGYKDGERSMFERDRGKHLRRDRKARPRDGEGA